MTLELFIFDLPVRVQVEGSNYGRAKSVNVARSEGGQKHTIAGGIGHDGEYRRPIRPEVVSMISIVSQELWSSTINKCSRCSRTKATISVMLHKHARDEITYQGCLTKKLSKFQMT